MVNSHSRLVLGGAGYANSTGVTFIPLCSGALTTRGANNSTETTQQVTYRTVGTFTNLLANCSSHTSNTVLTLRNNAGGTAGNETVTLSATGIVEDTTHNDTVTAGNKYDIQLSALASTVAVIAITYAATTNTACRIMCTNNAGVADSVGAFQPLAGLLTAAGVTESQAQTIIKKTGTLTNFLVNVVASSSATGTWISRVAAGNGNLTVTSTASTTGITEDTTHTDNRVSGDLANYERSAGTFNGNIGILGCDFTSTNGDSMVENATASPGTIATSLTKNYPLCGDLSQPASEAITEVTARDAYTCSLLTMNVFANGITGATAVRFRVNGGNGNQVASTTTTGNITDTTNTDTTTATQDINYQLITGAGGTNITISAIIDWMNIGGAGGVVVIPPKFFTVQNQGEFLPGLYPGISKLPPMFVT